jgi:hypothetical protein
MVFSKRAWAFPQAWANRKTAGSVELHIRRSLICAHRFTVHCGAFAIASTSPNITSKQCLPNELARFQSCLKHRTRASSLDGANALGHTQLCKQEEAGMAAHLLKSYALKSYALKSCALSCATALVLFADGRPVAAQSDPGFYDGKRLYAVCSRNDAAGQAECAGFIMGIVDALADVRSIHGYESCSIRKQATEAQIIDWVKGSLADRLQLLDNQASMLVASALSWKFACPSVHEVPPPCCAGPPSSSGKR